MTRDMPTASAPALPTRLVARPPVTHYLKSWPQFFEPLVRGRKTFEVRRNDRNFQEGDLLRLAEWDPELREFTGREATRRVTHVADLGEIGLHGFVAMGVEEER